MAKQSQFAITFGVDRSNIKSSDLQDIKVTLDRAQAMFSVPNNAPMFRYQKDYNAAKAFIENDAQKLKASAPIKTKELNDIATQLQEQKSCNQDELESLKTAKPALKAALEQSKMALSGVDQEILRLQAELAAMQNAEQLAADFKQKAPGIIAAANTTKAQLITELAALEKEKADAIQVRERAGEEVINRLKLQQKTAQESYTKAIEAADEVKANLLSSIRAKVVEANTIVAEALKSKTDAESSLQSAKQSREQFISSLQDSAPQSLQNIADKIKHLEVELKESQGKGANAVASDEAFYVGLRQTLLTKIEEHFAGHDAAFKAAKELWKQRRDAPMELRTMLADKFGILTSHSQEYDEVIKVQGSDSADLIEIKKQLQQMETDQKDVDAQLSALKPISGTIVKIKAAIEGIKPGEKFSEEVIPLLQEVGVLDLYQSELAAYDEKKAAAASTMTKMESDLAAQKAEQARLSEQYAKLQKIIDEYNDLKDGTPTAAESATPKSSSWFSRSPSSASVKPVRTTAAVEADLKATLKELGLLSDFEERESEIVSAQQSLEASSARYEQASQDLLTAQGRSIEELRVGLKTDQWNRDGAEVKHKSYSEMAQELLALHEQGFATAMETIGANIQRAREAMDAQQAIIDKTGAELAALELISPELKAAKMTEVQKAIGAANITKDIAFAAIQRDKELLAANHAKTKAIEATDHEIDHAKHVIDIDTQNLASLPERVQGAFSASETIVSKIDHAQAAFQGYSDSLPSLTKQYTDAEKLVKAIERKNAEIREVRAAKREAENANLLTKAATLLTSKPDYDTIIRGLRDEKEALVNQVDKVMKDLEAPEVVEMSSYDLSGLTRIISFAKRSIDRVTLKIMTLDNTQDLIKQDQDALYDKEHGAALKLLDQDGDLDAVNITQVIASAQEQVAPAQVAQDLTHKSSGIGLGTFVGKVASGAAAAAYMPAKAASALALAPLKGLAQAGSSLSSLLYWKKSADSPEVASPTPVAATSSPPAPEPSTPVELTPEDELAAMLGTSVAALLAPDKPVDTAPAPATPVPAPAAAASPWYSVSTWYGGAAEQKMPVSGDADHHDDAQV